MGSNCVCAANKLPITDISLNETTTNGSLFSLYNFI